MHHGLVIRHRLVRAFDRDSFVLTKVTSHLVVNGRLLEVKL